MSNKKLPAILFETVAAELKLLGFKLLKGKKRFVRLVDNRREDFWLVILDDRPGYRICPAVSVRFGEVETIYHRTSGFEPEYQKDTSTVGIDLWAVYGKQGFQLALNNEADVPGLVAQLLTIFREKALPYFSQFSTLAAVDAALNDQPTEKCVYAQALPIARCSTGLIVAKLTGRKNYDELVRIYHSVVEKDGHGCHFLRNFVALLSDLASVPSNKPL
jgi:hypothetical protein